MELQVQISECDFPYKLGSFTIVLQESKNFQLNDCFTLTFEPQSTFCTVSWSETEENSETQVIIKVKLLFKVVIILKLLLSNLIYKILIIM